jgi:type II secretory pathway component GspD/PulD (secretin)
MDDNHTRSYVCRLLPAVLTVLAISSLCGCHDLPDETVTAIETQNILRDIGEMETVAEFGAPWPAFYRQPPSKIKQIVGGVEEWKLVYFCRHNTADQMKRIVHDQFASRLFDSKRESTTIPDYGVTANSATNQLVVRCATEADVDAVLELLEHADIAPIQVKISCIVSELYSSMTMDRETTVLIENLFGESIRLGGKSDDGGNVLPAFPGASLRDLAREKFGLKIGVSSGQEGHRFETLVDILVSRGYLKILMNPTLQAVNGQSARIEFEQHVPLQQITIQSGGFGGETVLRTQTEYYDIIDSLEITPHVYVDGHVGLDVQVQTSAHLAPAGVKQAPIVTSNAVANEASRIRLGESLIIGGMRKSERLAVTRGVPILKDIPVLNLLFSGRDFEERAKEVIFILTPTISTM